MTNRLDNSALINRIKASGLFDEVWYLENYPDVEVSGLGAVEHYLRIGAWLGREPAADFNTGQYLRENPEISSKDILPLVHMITKDDPRAVTDTAAEMPAGTAPAEVIHYDVLPIDQAYYLRNNPDVGLSNFDVQKHFDIDGHLEMRNPRADFDMWWYTQNYLLGTPDSGANALAHYNKTGAALGHLTRLQLRC